MKKDILEIIKMYIEIILMIFGSLIASYEYRRFRKNRPKIEFEVDFISYKILKKEDLYLLDIDLIVHNKGQVRNYFPEIFVEVKGLTNEDMNNCHKSQTRLKFSKELISKHNILPVRCWVDAGVTQSFRYPVIIKGTNSFIQVNAQFHYYIFKIPISYHQASCIKPLQDED